MRANNMVDDALHTYRKIRAVNGPTTPTMVTCLADLLAKNDNVKTLHTLLEEIDKHMLKGKKPLIMTDETVWDTIINAFKQRAAGILKSFNDTSLYRCTTCREIWKNESSESTGQKSLSCNTARGTQRGARTSGTGVATRIANCSESEEAMLLKSKIWPFVMLYIMSKSNAKVYLYQVPVLHLHLLVTDFVELIYLMYII